jgi:hypothetical protein
MSDAIIKVSNLGKKYRIGMARCAVRLPALSCPRRAGCSKIPLAKVGNAPAGTSQRNDTLVWSAQTRPRFETGRHVSQSESGD